MARPCQTTAEQLPGIASAACCNGSYTCALDAHSGFKLSQRYRTSLVIGLLVCSCNNVYAESFNFDLVTIPTDIVATIVNVEDDIILSDQPQKNTVGSTKSAIATEDSNTTTELALTDKSESDEDTAEPMSSNSIFSESTVTQVVEAEATVVEQEQETVVAAIDKNASVIASGQSIVESVTVEDKPSGNSIFEPATVEIIEQIEQPAPEIASLAEDTVNKDTTDSVFENVVTDQGEAPVLIVEQPISASDAADMSTMPDESQGVIVVSETVSESVTEKEISVVMTAASSESATEDSVTNSSTVTEFESARDLPDEVITTVTLSEPVASESDAALVALEAPVDQVTAVELVEPVDQSTAEIQDQTGAETVQNVVTAAQEEAINEDEIIIAWATAWSNNQTEDYLAFYADEFKPANKSLDRAAWEQQRRKRLENKNIRIIVSNAEVYRVEGDVTEVRFTQRYTSASYKDRVIKSMEMIKTDKGWQFISETTIEELPFE